MKKYLSLLDNSLVLFTLSVLVSIIFYYFFYTSDYTNYSLYTLLKRPQIFPQFLLSNLILSTFLTGLFYTLILKRKPLNFLPEKYALIYSILCYFGFWGFTIPKIDTDATSQYFIITICTFFIAFFSLIISNRLTLYAINTFKDISTKNLKLYNFKVIPLIFLCLFIIDRTFSISNFVMNKLQKTPLQESTLLKDKLYVFLSQNKIGYVNYSGKVIISPQFKEARTFNDGLAAATIDGKKWGYIDKTGKFVIKPRYTDVNDFTEKTAKVIPHYKGRYSIINTFGKIIIKDQENCPDTGVFHNGLAKFCNNNKYGFMNITGNTVIKPQFDSIDYFKEDLASFQVYTKDKDSSYKRSKYGFIDPTGKIVIQAKYTSASNFNEKFARVVDMNKAANKGYDLSLIDENFAYIDKTGKTVFKQVGKDFQEGLAAIKINNKYGFMNKSGKTVIPPRFMNTEGFKNGFAVVSIAPVNSSTNQTNTYIDYRYGFINKAGTFTIKPIYTEAQNFSESLAAVALYQLPSTRFDRLLSWYGYTPSIKWGYINKSGQFVISPKYDNAYPFKDGTAIVKIGKKYATIDKTGRIIAYHKYQTNIYN